MRTHPVPNEDQSQLSMLNPGKSMQINGQDNVLDTQMYTARSNELPKNQLNRKFPIPKGESYSPKDFIKEVSLQVDITNYLPKIKRRICSYGTIVSLIELEDQESKDFFKGNYILEISGSANKVYRKALQTIVRISDEDGGSERRTMLAVNIGDTRLFEISFIDFFNYSGVDQVETKICRQIGQKLVLASDNMVKMISFSWYDKDLLLGPEQIYTLQLGNRDSPISVLDIAFPSFFENGKFRLYYETAENKIQSSLIVFKNQSLTFEKQIDLPLASKLRPDFIYQKGISFESTSGNNYTYLVDRLGNLEIYHQGKPLNKFNFSTIHDERNLSLEMESSDSESLIVKHPLGKDYYTFSVKKQSGQAFQKLELKEYDPQDLTEIIMLQSKQKSYSVCFNLSRVFIAHHNVVKLVDISTGNLVKKVFLQREFREIFCFELEFYVILKEEIVQRDEPEKDYSSYQCLYKLNSEETEFEKVQDVRGKFEQLYIDNQQCYIVTEIEFCVNSVKRIQAEGKVSSYKYDQTLHQNDVKRFYILNYHHYSELEERIERVIFYDYENFKMMIMDFDKGIGLVKQTLLSMNTNYHTTIKRVLQIQEKDQNLFFWSQYSDYSLHKYDMKNQKVTSGLKEDWRIDGLQFLDYLIFSFDQQGLEYRSIYNFIPDDVKTQSSSKTFKKKINSKDGGILDILLDDKVSINRRILINQFKLAYLIFDQKQGRISLQILPQPHLPYIIPFGIQANQHRRILSWKKIDNKIITHQFPHKLLTFNALNGHVIQNIDIDDRLIPQKIYGCPGVITPIYNEVRPFRPGNPQSQLGSSFNQIQSAINLFHDTSDSLKDPKIMNETAIQDLHKYLIVEIENENRVKILASFFSPGIASVKDAIFSDDFEKMILINKIYSKQTLPCLDEIGAFYFKEVSLIKSEYLEGSFAFSGDLTHHARISENECEIIISNIFEAQTIMSIQLFAVVKRIFWRGANILVMKEEMGTEKYIQINFDNCTYESIFESYVDIHTFIYEKHTGYQDLEHSNYYHQNRSRPIQYCMMNKQNLVIDWQQQLIKIKGNKGPNSSFHRD